MNEQTLPPGYSERSDPVDFTTAVPDGGYHWWYVDAISDDGSQAMTLIVFVGSVFSPYYAAARRRGQAAADRHCAFNAILYGPGTRKRWSMTERGRESLRRQPEQLAIGPSELRWEGDTLVARIEERCVPLPYRLRGEIRVTPSTLTRHRLQLDRQGRHFWEPLGPVARVEVDMPAPGVHWRGDGYLDSNHGSEPLENGFARWDWSRGRLGSGDCAVLYHTEDRGGEQTSLALRLTADGQLSAAPAAAPQPLPRAAVWQMYRGTLGTHPGEAQVVKTLEDTPFYTRSLIEGRVFGERVHSVHESLDLRRFSARWIQWLLPFRMPRRA